MAVKKTIKKQVTKKPTTLLLPLLGATDSAINRILKQKHSWELAVYLVGAKTAINELVQALKNK